MRKQEQKKKVITAWRAGKSQRGRDIQAKAVKDEQKFAKMLYYDQGPDP